MDKGSDKTIRNVRKWARVVGERGRWHVAMGYQGEFMAVTSCNTCRKIFAETVAREWLTDGEPKVSA
jgi:hypothetical protein